MRKRLQSRQSFLKIRISRQDLLSIAILCNPKMGLHQDLLEFKRTFQSRFHQVEPHEGHMWALAFKWLTNEKRGKASVIRIPFDAIQFLSCKGFVNLFTEYYQKNLQTH